ncbi:hypothetical protein Hte_002546 [Hypoxylon texense]
MEGVPLSPEAREKMLGLPAQQPPPNIALNFENPWSMESSAEKALHILLALSTVMFLVKIYRQLLILHKFGLEDCVLVLAWLQYCLLVIWGIIILFLNITILLQYLRVFVPTGTRNFTFWAIYGALYANIAYYVAFMFLQIFACTPREQFWDKSITEGRCMDIIAINVSGAVVCLVSDVAILLIPQSNPQFEHCQGEDNQTLACVTSAVRVYYNVRLWQNQTDITYQLACMSFWGTAQVPAGFLVTCLPSVPKVLNHTRAMSRITGLETSPRSIFRVSKKKVQSTTQIITIGGGPKRDQKATVVSDAEFRDLVATDGMSLASTTHIDPESRKYL